MLPQEIIAIKRDGGILTPEQMNIFVDMVTQGTISDAQIAAFCMAVVLNDLSQGEVVSLTKAMAQSGQTIDWSDMDLNGPVLDKHSSGGVGDKISLIVAPIIAACGGYVGKISGRGLGHTGGTIDKLMSIPGISFDTSLDDFKKIVKNIGCGITSQKVDLVPADKKIYAIRDVTATVDHIGLITASIVSKKLAMNPFSFTADIKVGSGAMMENIDEARLLAKNIVDIANGAGLKTTALITGMNQILSHSAGNALEIKEVIEYLKGEMTTKRLDDLVKAIASQMLMSGGLYQTVEQAEKAIIATISSGTSLEKFGQMIHALGGPIDFVDNYDQYLATAPIIKDIIVKKDGFITQMDVHDIGMAIVDMGGGRRRPSDDIDPSVGLDSMLGIGEYAESGKTKLCSLHAKDDASWQAAADKILQAVTIDNSVSSVESRSIIKEIITA